MHDGPKKTQTFLLAGMSHAIHVKEENVILVGVISGPSEPELAMNAYLSPLVELKQGWERGFNVKTSQGVQVPIRPL